MTQVAEAVPHSRWRLVKDVDALAGSQDAASAALDAFARAAAGYDPSAVRTAQASRRRARRIDRHTAWYLVAVTLAGVLMGWVGLRTLGRATGGHAPAAIAVLPGVLIALALAGATSAAAGALRGAGALPGSAGRHGPAVQIALFGGSLSGAAVWCALWLAGTVTSGRPWAIVGGVILVLACGSGALAARLAAPATDDRTADAHATDAHATDGITRDTDGSAQATDGSAHAAGGPWPRLPRRIRRARDRATAKMRDHSVRWNAAAHRCGAVLATGRESGDMLIRLVESGEMPPVLPDDIDTTYAIVLAGLGRHRPERLAERYGRINRPLLPPEEDAS
jgi:hypothetical protein